MIRLANLNQGEKFTWNNTRYTVYSHESGMTEVFGNGRFWAWPSRAMVRFR